ncbi:hypothetical protein DFH07DRAFT_962994 [Mycena maculata]|uniref:No apical meristem-associated C-terminal domain-containing protein n=1 Tax=Mycena maculata TaxID=230809 RepID=A0AAD7ILX9_9AGAR|nr:hypothetical protein DFH07DRAFT_962994 [Mycena maculata]
MPPSPKKKRARKTQKTNTVPVATPVQSADKENHDINLTFDENSQVPNTASQDLDASSQGLDATQIEWSESETESTTKRWPMRDRDKFYKFLLGSDAEGDKRFEQHKRNPGHVYERASQILFNGKRSADSIKGQWQRSLKTFEWIVAFESFTGNGGGDGDSNDASAVLKGKLTRARAAGIAIGSLTPAKIKEWDDNHWRDLFEERLGNSAKVTRPVVRSSAAPLSDAEDLDNESDDGAIDPILKSQTKKTAAATVSEPKHAPASKFRAQASESFGNIGALVKVKIAADEKRAQALGAKLELDERRFKLESTKAKVDLARSVFGTDGVSAEVRDAANSFLLGYFTS